VQIVWREIGTETLPYVRSGGKVKLSRQDFYDASNVAFAQISLAPTPGATDHA
jgi:hypothetical protein